MGDDEILRIAAQFDVSEITAGMDVAASAVQTGAARIASSMKASGASAEETASALKNLGYSATEVKAAMGPAAAELDEVSASADRMTRSVNNSRIAFTGLTQDLGLRGSRALGSFIAQSATLGPILQAAFPIVAAVAFVEIIEAGYTKLLDATSGLAGWTKEAQHMQSVLIELNSQQVTFNEKLAIEKLALSEVGLKGEALDQQKLLNLGVERGLVQDAYNESKKKEASINAELLQGELAKSALVKLPSTFGIPIPVPAQGLSKERIAELNKELEQAMKKTADLDHELKTLDQVTIPKSGLEVVAKDAEEAAKAAQKYHDALAKIRDEETSLTQRNAEKELRDLERVTAEKERLDEELEKETQELAKKDLDTLERSLTERVRLQEEAGRNELEAIRATAEAQAKAVQARSSFGGADPRIIEIADKALDEQAFKIMDLIALEEKLRQTLQQTGMAETDPKIQESLTHQQQLVQQLAVAMQKYDQAIQKVGEAELKQFEKNFETVTASVNRGILSWVDGTEKFSRAMMQVWTGIVNSAVQGVLKIGEQWLMTHLEMAVIGKATGTASAESQIAAAAGEAFANTYAAISAIPIVGPGLAPGMAAASAAATLSGGMGFLAFEKGGIMGNSEGLALLHPREMVLPANISQSVQQMASSNGSGGGGGHFHTEIHVHGNPSSSEISKIEKQMTAVIKRARRRGNL